jgi:hypothetical protein
VLQRPIETTGIIGMWLSYLRPNSQIPIRGLIKT